MIRRRHTPIEDVHALLIGSSFIAVELTLPKTADLANQQPGRYAGYQGAAGRGEMMKNCA